MTVASTSHYDVVVVGAGSSGCPLAVRLSEDSSRSVLLLEAGKDFGPIESYPRELAQAYLSAFSLPGNPHSWSLMANLTRDLTYPITRGKLVGGSSAVNGAVYLRGHQEDYDSWAASGSSEWSYQKVLPFLKRQETDLDFGETDIHGGSGPIPVGRSEEGDLTPVSNSFVEACLALDYKWDIDMNGPATQGVGLVPHNTLGGIRQNVATRYLEPAKARPNLTVVSEALVHRVVFRGTRATAVEASCGDAKRIFSGDEIVLCCGAIKTPQILMLSGIGPRGVLHPLGIDIVHESPFVGRNLMDHPGVKISFQTAKYQPQPGPIPLSEVAGNFLVGDSGSTEVRIYPFLYSRTNQLFGVFQSQAIAKRMRAMTSSASPLRTVRSIRGTSLRALREELADRHDLSFFCSLGLEESRGELGLLSTDPTAAPLIEYEYMTSSVDLEHMRDTVRLTFEITQQSEFRRLKSTFRSLPTSAEMRDDSALNEWIMRHLGTSYHSAGTCKMGAQDDESAVVDQYCRVKGVEGLRVVDISILPTITRRPTNATAIMLGERAAELMTRSRKEFEEPGPVEHSE